MFPDCISWMLTVNPAIQKNQFYIYVLLDHYNKVYTIMDREIVV